MEEKVSVRNDKEKLQVIRKALDYTIKNTELGHLGRKITGKVRDSYLGEGRRYLVTTDRLSCFDVVITTIPFKGQLLNKVAVESFEATQDIIPNHIVDVPDPNIMVVKECEVLPVELVVRGYLAGGGWRSYRDSQEVSGITLPAGLNEFQKLETPLITPSTKAIQGEHDEPISAEQIISQGILSKGKWEELSELVLALFARGSSIALERGLLLADTKYEIGVENGRFILVDEVHTFDCSRYWRQDSYEKLTSAGHAPDMLDKEPARRWLHSQGYDGTGALPEIPESWREEVALHYWNAADLVLGKACELDVEDGNKRLEKFAKDTVN